MCRVLCIYNHTPGTWRGRGAYQFYPTCDFLQIFHSKVQLAIQGLPCEFPGAPTCAEIRSEHECARVNAMAVGNAL